MASLPIPRFTEEEYLRLEETAFEKSEFHDGQMFAMAGGTANHALIMNAIGTILHRQKPAGCRVFSSELRIKVERAGLYTYPDCSLLCGDPVFTNSKKNSLRNPVLLVEVLSESTEAASSQIARGEKFEMYRMLDSLREYLLIHSDRRHLEHYSRQDDNSWLLREYSGPDAIAPISRMGIQIPLSELYADAFDLA